MLLAQWPVRMPFLLNIFMMKAADLPSCAGGIIPTGKRAFMSQINTLEIYGVGD